jgi:hypothetical protein
MSSRTYEDLPATIETIATTAYLQGLKQLEQINSSDLTRESEPKLEQLCFVEIPRLFQPFLAIPDPASFHTPIGKIESAMAKLSTGDLHRDPLSESGHVFLANPDLESLPSSLNLIDSWTGPAAQNFVTVVIQPFRPRLRNQYILLSVIRSSLEAEQAIWREVRTDITKIADQTLSAFEAMLQHNCRSKAFPVVLSVVAAIASVALELPSLGTSTALTIAAIGAASSLIGGVSNGDKVEVKISGGEPATIVDSLRRCIDLEYRLVRDADDRVARALNGLTDAARARSDLFATPHPLLATSDDVTGPGSLGRPSH